jgi:hypothetical protein
MDLKISKHDTTIDVKAAFAQKYKGLKIEFFHKAHGENEGSPKKDMVEEVVGLTELNPNIQNEKLHITANMKVSELESAFEDKLGLHVQVFRKMGHIWIETTRTDHYSLKEQMNMSEESLKGY